MKMSLSSCLAMKQEPGSKSTNTVIIFPFRCHESSMSCCIALYESELTDFLEILLLQTFRENGTTFRWTMYQFCFPRCVWQTRAQGAVQHPNILSSRRWSLPAESFVIHCDHSAEGTRTPSRRIEVLGSRSWRWVVWTLEPSSFLWPRLWPQARRVSEALKSGQPLRETRKERKSHFESHFYLFFRSCKQDACIYLPATYFLFSKVDVNVACVNITIILKYWVNLLRIEWAIDTRNKIRMNFQTVSVSALGIRRVIM